MHTKISHTSTPPPFLNPFPNPNKLPFHLAATFFQISPEQKPHHHKLTTSSIKLCSQNLMHHRYSQFILIILSVSWTARIHLQLLSTHTSLQAFASTPPTKNSSFTTSREKLLPHPFPSPSSPTLISTSSILGSSQVCIFLTPHFIFSSLSSNPSFKFL